MIYLTGARIKTTTYSDSPALQSFYSYTLPNTPFYFKIYFQNSDPTYRKKFSNNQIIWDFGDGTFSTGITAEHVYKWPGEYVVRATLYDINGEVHDIYTDSNLLVYNAIPDIVTFGGLNNQDIAYPLLAGRKSPALNVYRYNSWQYNNFLNDSNYKINLYASNSNSSYTSVSSYYSSQWSHLKAFWGFVLESANENNYLQEVIVDSTITNSVSVYAEKINTGYKNNNWNVKLKFYNYPAPNTVFAGTSGTIPDNVKLRFVDQKPSDNKRESYVALYGSIDTSIFKDNDYLKYNYNPKDEYGFINTTYSTIFLKTLFNPASSLKITSNGISEEGIPTTSYLSAYQLNYAFDIYPIKFTNSKIPFLITFKDSDNITTKCYPLLNLNNDRDTKMELNDVRVELVYFTKNQYLPLSSSKIIANTAVPLYNESGSYFAGIVECPQEANAVAISATALIVDNPIAAPNKSIGFIMQPGLNKMRRVSNILSYGYSNGLSSFGTSFESLVDTVEGSLSGGVCITYVPLNLKYTDKLGMVWVTNADADSINVFNEDGSVYLRPINLRKMVTRLGNNNVKTIDITEKKSAAPISIAADSVGDAWVAFRDTVSAFKFNKDNLIATACATPNIKNTQYYSASSYVGLSAEAKGFVGENLILPSSIDVDKDDNIYVAYSHPISSFVVQYDKNGTQTDLIPFVFPYTAKQLLVDLNGNLWVTTFNNSPIDYIDNPQTQNITDRKDFLYYIDTKNLFNSFVKTFSMLGDLTMDSGGNVWVNSRNNFVHKVTPDGSVFSFRIGNPESATDYVQDFGGLAGDINGNLWIINNTEGSLIYFNTINPKQLNLSQIPRVALPESNTYIDESGIKAYYITTGDFTGVKWAIKNRAPISTFPRYVSGLSNLFSINSPAPGLVKKNENYDLAKTFKSYVLQESLANSDNLFDNFISPILNGDNKNTDALGKVIYEKISNYVDNIADIDTCNLDSLYSLYQMFGEKLDQLTFTVPPSLKKTLNTLSIKQSKLFGNKNYYSKNFKLSSFDFDVTSNLGSTIDIETGHFIVGRPIISYELFSQKYNLIQNTIVPEHDALLGQLYPLSSINYSWGWGLVVDRDLINYKDLKNYYKFYNYIPIETSQLYDGIIDFNDPLTTISKNTSSFEDWTAYAGDMEFAISSSLYRSMGLAFPPKSEIPLPTPRPSSDKPNCFKYVTYNNQTLEFSSNLEYGCYIVIDKTIEIFNIAIDNNYGIFFSSNYDQTKPINSNIQLTTVGPISTNKSIINLGENATILYNNNYFTFYFFNTGSLICGFGPKNNQMLPISQIP